MANVKGSVGFSNNSLKLLDFAFVLWIVFQFVEVCPRAAASSEMYMQSIISPGDIGNPTFYNASSSLECLRICRKTTAGELFNFNTSQPGCTCFSGSSVNADFSENGNGVGIYGKLIASYPYDCLDAFNNGETVDGIYSIQPMGGQQTTAWCDMTNGGWTVIQRRMDGSENFERLWAEYAAGFGSRGGEYWLGLNNIHLLTSVSSSLEIELEAWPGETTLTEIETYNNFSVGPEASNFTLYVGGFMKNNDSCVPLFEGFESALIEFQNGRPFSTEDREAENATELCSWNTRGPWWHAYDCFPLSLNGVYFVDGHYNTTRWLYEGIAWHTCWDFTYSLKTSVMKIKRN